MQITISGQGGSGTIVATNADTKKYTTTKLGLRKQTNWPKKVSSWENLKKNKNFINNKIFKVAHEKVKESKRNESRVPGEVDMENTPVRYGSNLSNISQKDEKTHLFQMLDMLKLEKTHEMQNLVKSLKHRRRIEGLLD